MCYHGIIQQFCSYLRQKHKLLILSCLRNFITFSTRFTIQSEGSISELWNTVGRKNSVYIYICSSDTHKYKL